MNELAAALRNLAGFPVAFLLARRRGIDLRHAGSARRAAKVLRTRGVPNAVIEFVMDATKACPGLSHSDCGEPATRSPRAGVDHRNITGLAWLRGAKESRLRRRVASAPAELASRRSLRLAIG